MPSDAHLRENQNGFREERTTLAQILALGRHPPNLLRAIESMYRYARTRAKVVTPDGDSEEFDIQAGVMQGDTLAPLPLCHSLGPRAQEGHRRTGAGSWLHSNTKEVKKTPCGCLDGPGLRG